MNNRQKSLSEVHGSVDVSKGKSKWRKIFAFFGPAYLVSVGYMDPGNWATDIAGGSQFGYTLIWVLVLSNLMALLLQSFSARLGIVRGQDLAQCNREAYPRGMNFILYVLAELAIAACDLAEILGMAIGLQLLFGIDLIWGVLIGFINTFLLLWLQRFGMRKMELFIISTIALIGACFLVEMIMAKPDIGEIAKGLIPSIPNNDALYIAIGIIGATVMPHNLYLHSALVQTRKIEADEKHIRKALKYNFWDSAIALNLALFVNAALLILAASVFHSQGKHDVVDLNDAHRLLEPMMGSEWAPRLFAIALIAAGQSSAVTGTLAGQIVMEGYLRLRISPLMRRLVTRLLATIPAVLVILIMGESKVGALLIFSQVLLSMQLAFAVIPLIHFVSNKFKMGRFAIKPFVKVLAWAVAALVSVLNLKLVYNEASSWMGNTDSFWLKLLIVLGYLGLIALLVLTIVYPLITRRWKQYEDMHEDNIDLQELNVPEYGKIAVALDFSIADRAVLAHLLKLAQPGTPLVLIHITESASPQLMNHQSEDLETRSDQERLVAYADSLQNRGFPVTIAQGHSRRHTEIARICKEQKAGLLIIGSHGHKGFQDFIFGTTVNRVRHLVQIPVLVAR